MNAFFWPPLAALAANGFEPKVDPKPNIANNPNQRTSIASSVGQALISILCMPYLLPYFLWAGSFLAAATISPSTAITQEAPRCMPLSVPIAFVDDAPEPYGEFCRRHDGACELTGPSIIEWTPTLQDLLRKTNVSVNGSIQFIPDSENSGLEEIWDFPANGTGDCEDFALEKRRQLHDLGLPSASMTCAIAFHQVKLFAHAVLMVETTAGTFVLDNLSDEVLCWDEVPYFFTKRERPDGQWTRFQQPYYMRR